jgi:hypothetical protein
MAGRSELLEQDTVLASYGEAGFVERLAGPLDLVCVTPESHQRLLQENATATSRRNPNGPYGPNTCITGFVWREAFAGDFVLVPPGLPLVAFLKESGVPLRYLYWRGEPFSFLVRLTWQGEL